MSTHPTAKLAVVITPLAVRGCIFRFLVVRVMSWAQRNTHTWKPIKSSGNHVGNHRTAQYGVRQTGANYASA